jgi:hypothetical protein
MSPVAHRDVSGRSTASPCRPRCRPLLRAGIFSARSSSLYPVMVAALRAVHVAIMSMCSVCYRESPRAVVRDKVCPYLRFGGVVLVDHG